jgi:hypothetical protein
MLNKLGLTAILLISAAGMGGLIVGQVIGVYAQNNTSSSTDATVNSLDKMIYVAIVPTAIAVIGLLSTLAQKGYFNKRTSDALIMAADASRAVSDTRETFNKYANTSMEVLKLASPETAKQIEIQVVPVLDEISGKILEYKPKVDAFAAIASGSSRAGEKASDSMKSLRKDIPNNIVASSTSSSS